MSVMSTGRRPGAAVRRLSPEHGYSLPRQPGPTGGARTVSRRPARPRLRLVPPLPTGPAADRPPAPPRGRISAPADARVPAPRTVPVPPARVAGPGDTPARVPGPADTPARVAGPGDTPARIVRPASRPAVRRRSRRKVRLTRRGRVVVWVLATLAAAALLTPVWLLAAAGAQAANHGLPPAAVHAGMRHVVVQPGQTLWSIAMAADPTADPRIVSQEIIQVNALSSGVVIPGESLWVPAS
jgi:LysM domain-containing protein